MANSPLVRPYVLGEGTLDSHDIWHLNQNAEEGQPSQALKILGLLGCWLNRNAHKSTFGKWRYKNAYEICSSMNETVEHNSMNSIYMCIYLDHIYI